MHLYACRPKYVKRETFNFKINDPPPPHTNFLNVTCKAKKRNDERVLDLAVQTTARTENLIETENSTYM